ncbi:MAG TPA: hypothetical protein DCE24_03580 [Porphyromonadaceae bacterium]|nr:hypothetical protein [Porphyromonadaceae bacterium]
MSRNARNRIAAEETPVPVHHAHLPTGLNSQRAPDVPTTQESVPAQVRADLPVRAIPVPRATVPALESTDPPALAIPAIM